jgi:hypothetical protein
MAKKLYNIIRKHSGDTNYSVIAQVSSKAAAKKFIKNEVRELTSHHITPTEVKHLDDVTNVNFNSRVFDGLKWSIGFWFELVPSEIQPEAGTWNGGVYTPASDAYERAITDEYNRMARMHQMVMDGEGVMASAPWAFLMNAIVNAVMNSHSEDLYNYFNKNASH